MIVRLLYSNSPNCLPCRIDARQPSQILHLRIDGLHLLTRYKSHQDHWYVYRDIFDSDISEKKDVQKPARLLYHYKMNSLVIEQSYRNSSFLRSDFKIKAELNILITLNILFSATNKTIKLFCNLQAFSKLSEMRNENKHKAWTQINICKNFF